MNNERQNRTGMGLAEFGIVRTVTRVVAMVGALLPLGVVREASAAPAAAPNIILIVADDLGYGELGSYGQKRIATPALDRMAAEGVRFTQFYAGSPVCAPSRSVLMTGQHVGHTTVRGNSPVQNYAGTTLRANDVTVAAVLKSAGYRTAAIGKWGLGLGDSTGAPWKHGFDEFFGFLSQTHAHNHFPDHLWRNQEKVSLGNDLIPVGELRVAGVGYATTRREYANDLFFDEAEKFIARNRAGNFFLYLALTVPHANNERAAALGDGQEVPDYGPYANEPWTDPLKGQAAMITRMDRQIGALINRLRELGLDRNTVVMFTSDNGPHNEGGPSYSPEFFNSNGALRGIKRDLTEGGIRVPLIVHWSGVTSAGKVISTIGHFADVMATCADLAGVRAPDRIDGVSLVPAFRGNAAAVRAREYLYWEFYERGFQQAVLLRGRWKALRSPTGEVTLYDLEQDPGETDDVSAAQRDVVTRCLGIMDEAHVPNAWWRRPVERETKAGASRVK